jgi:hypothetical protein
VLGRRVSWIVLVALYALAALALIAFLAPSTFVGADLAVYQRAGRDLYEHGDPYYSASEVPYVFQYRYPPLLAMLMPVLGWPPLWYGVMAACTAFTLLMLLRSSGPAGFLPIIVLGGAWGQVLLNGNVQPALMALLCVVPLWRRTGAVSLAVATMLKLHPALGVVWYLGRRDWQALRWFAAALVVLALIQAPWLPAMVEFYVAQPLASPFEQAGFGLRAIHPLLWLGGTAAMLILAWRYADTPYGWLLATGLQLVALPRVLLANLALLLAAPISRPATGERAPDVPR